MSSLSYRKEIAATLRLAWPIMGAQLLTLGMVFTDNVMVARLGEKPLGALAIAGTLYSTLYIVSMGVLSAMSPAISHAYGAGNANEVGSWFRQGARFSFLLSALSMFVLWNGGRVLSWLGQSPELAALAQEFLRAIAIGVPAQTLYFCARTVCEGTSDSRPSIVIAALGVLLNVFLDYVLIYGRLGFPALGVMGAGLATAGVNWMMAIAIGIYLARHERYRAFRLFDSAPFWNGAFVRELLRVGAPISGCMLAEMGFFAGATLVMGTIGNHALASHQIAINAASFTFMIPLGLSFAVSIRVGQHRGRGDSAGAFHSGRSGFWLTLILQSVPAGLFLFFPRVVTILYTSDPSLTATAVTLLKVAGVFQIFDGLQVVGIAALRGLKDTKLPFLNTLVSFWLLGAPAALWMAGTRGPTGIWLGMVLGLGLAAGLHLARFHNLSRRLV